jgi:hypothetical protein
LDCIPKWIRTKAYLFLILLTIAAPHAVKAGRPDSTAKDSSAVPRKSPLKAVFFSAVFPGGGQIYTGNYWRAVGLGTAEVSLAGAATYEVWRMNKASDQAEIDRHFEKQRSLWWWAAGAWAFSLADAYVDAYLYKFDEQGKVVVRMGTGGLKVILARDL